MRKKLFIWQIKFLSCLVIVGLVCIMGCGFEDNGHVHVHNMTDQTITVKYDYYGYDMFNDYEAIYGEKINIKPNQVEGIWVMIDNDIDGGFCDGKIWVNYNGKKKGYDLDFDPIWGDDTVKVKTKHFL